MDRKNFIGASEVSSILGLNPFCTPLQLWGYKTGVLVREEKETEGQEWGHRLERVVSKKFSDEHNVKLIAYKKRFVHPEMNYFSCELDNIISGTDEIVEIKTVNAFDWKKWEKPDELPAYVIVQITSQMGLTGRKKAWVACLCGGQKYIEKEIKFDEELWKKIENEVKNFWENFVLNNTPPMAIGGDISSLTDLYPKSTGDIQTIDTFDEMIAHYLETQMHIKAMQKENEDIKAKIMQTIGNTAGFKTKDYLVKRIDVKASEYTVKKEASWYPRILKKGVENE